MLPNTAPPPYSLVLSTEHRVHRSCTYLHCHHTCFLLAPTPLATCNSRAHALRAAAQTEELLPAPIAGRLSSYRHDSTSLRLVGGDCNRESGRLRAHEGPITPAPRATPPHEGPIGCSGASRSGQCTHRAPSLLAGVPTARRGAMTTHSPRAQPPARVPRCQPALLPMLPAPPPRAAHHDNAENAPPNASLRLLQQHNPLAAEHGERLGCATSGWLLGCKRAGMSVQITRVITAGLSHPPCRHKAGAARRAEAPQRARARSQRAAPASAHCIAGCGVAPLGAAAAGRAPFAPAGD